MNWELLATTRINSVWKEIYDQRLNNSDYRWTRSTNGALGNVTPSTKPRIPVKNATWGEIALRVSDRVTIAPIIGYGQQATYKQPNVTTRLEQTNIPKIKHGMLIDEAMMIILMRVEENIRAGMVENTSTQDDLETFTAWEMEQLGNLAEGVQARIEHMAIGMLTNSYTYPNEKGEMFTMTWNVPGALSIWQATPYGNGTFGIQNANVNTTPISDFMALNLSTQQLYGFTYNRMSMSMKMLLYIIGTNEFKALAPLYLARMGFVPGASGIPYNDTAFMRTLVESMTGAIIEIDDRLVMIETNNLSNWNPYNATPASGQYIRYQAEGDIIFSRTQNDGDASVMDVANAPVIEARAGMVPGMIGKPQDGSVGANVYGPFSYATSANLNGNPPAVELWSTQNAVPRKKDLGATAVIHGF